MQRGYETMNCLLIADAPGDLGSVLDSSGVRIAHMTAGQALHADLSAFDAFCVFCAFEPLDPRLRLRLEQQAAAGKRLFLEAVTSWRGLYCAEPADTTRSRLVVVQPTDGEGIPGLATGDLLDDCSNRMARPWYAVPGMRPLLVYREHVIAHRHWDAGREEILRDSAPGLWLLGENELLCSFVLHNFNRARFAPRDAWQKVIGFLVRWLTGRDAAAFPEPVFRCGTDADLSSPAVFEEKRREAIRRGIRWLSGFLVDEGRGGIREGLRHNVSALGEQAPASAVRTDCAGEAAGAFRFYGKLYADGDALAVAENLRDFVLGPMTVRGGLFDGMLRWTDSAWQVCYQDDAARALLPMLYDCLLSGSGERFPEICRALDFLVGTTAKDGCRVSRTDAPMLTEKELSALRDAPHGTPSAHYNAYYHAALLLAYKFAGNRTYLQVARTGLETIMSHYPDTEREQSETEEQCRLILPLAALYDATQDERHRQMLYRVTHDLLQRRHPSGGFAEWDTGYTAKCSRESRGECSLLTHNGDPVADLLYSVNWLPIGFAWAYRVTGDDLFRTLWRDTAAFCINAQVHAQNPELDGAWCRAFDMALAEPYACPHDAGWAAYCCETGWTASEILMGLMLPEIPEHG